MIGELNLNKAIIFKNGIGNINIKLFLTYDFFLPLFIKIY